jgi:hypothetical protein
MLKPKRLNLSNVIAMMNAGASDDEVMTHFRIMLYDVRAVAQMIGRARTRQRIKIERFGKTDPDRKPIDPKQDWNMRSWKRESASFSNAESFRISEPNNRPDKDYVQIRDALGNPCSKLQLGDGVL